MLLIIYFWNVVSIKKKIFLCPVVIHDLLSFF